LYIFVDQMSQLLRYINNPMNLYNSLTSVLAFTAAGILIVIFAYYFIKSDIQRYFNIKAEEQKNEDRKQLLPLRLQAHERVTVFIDRINPANLFIRLYEPGLSVREFQAIILNDIRSEFQHNVTQQLYVSTATWAVVKKLKDDTVAMINNAVNSLPEGLPAMDLSKKVLQHMGGLENNPYDLTLDLIKDDIHQLF
jgi:hypothetical protein